MWFGLIVSSILISNISVTHSLEENSPWCPEAKCINTANCKPCTRRFLIVLAQGRSGSTTLKNMLNELPGIRLSGELGSTLGMLEKMYNYLLDDENLIKGRGNIKGSWGHNDYEPESLACPAQKLMETINPPGEKDDFPTDIIGFKEIRIDSEKSFRFLLRQFPCSKFVFNVRSDAVGLLRSQQTNFHGDGYENTSNKLPALYKRLADIVGPKRAFHMDMVDWAKNPRKFDELAEWLGYENCKYPSILHDNTGNGWELDKRNFDLGYSCRYAH